MGRISAQGQKNNARLANDLRPEGATAIPPKFTERGFLQFVSGFLNEFDAPRRGGLVALADNSYERPYLHPTKGWRGSGTRPRGTNCRRVKTI